MSEMVEKIVERFGPQITTWGMRIACWQPKATNTYTHLTIPVTLIMFGKLQTGSKERISGSTPLQTGPLKPGTN